MAEGLKERAQSTQQRRSNGYSSSAPKRKVSMDDYVDVAERLVEFRTKHENGSLQPANLAEPYKIEKIGDKTYIVVVAAAYRTPDDPRPGIGMAYEVFPGETNFTRNSELQNAETSAWGRAIMAVLAADSKRGVASAQEVRNRRAEQDEPQQPTQPAAQPVSMDTQLIGRIRAVGEKLQWGTDVLFADYQDRYPGEDLKNADLSRLAEYLKVLENVAGGE